MIDSRTTRVKAFVEREPDRGRRRAGSVEWRVAPHRNSTGVPTAVRRARNRASQFVSLTQPCDDV